MALTEFLLGLFLGGLIGAVIAWMISSRRGSTTQDRTPLLEEQIVQLQARLAEFRADLDRSEQQARTYYGDAQARSQEVASLREQLTQQRSLEEAMTKTFREVANEGLVQQGKYLTEQQQKVLHDVLSPLRERLKEFQERVEAGQKEALTTHTALMEQIRSLTELNQVVSEEANSLTRALKGESKTQGNWGELVLERVLEASGLEKGLAYRTQTTTTNQDGATIKPDVVVDLPDDKHIVIDSKVSLTAYEEYVAAEPGVPERDDALRRHVASIRGHIKGLADKDYHTATGLATPEFVLMFIPIESTFALTVKADADLFDFAWTRRIVLVSPSTLLATLKTIASLWKIEKQNRNALEIADRAGKLYDKFVGFVDDLQGAQKHLERSRDALDGAMGKLSTGKGNLIGQVERLKQLGVKAQKSLPDSLIGDEE